MGFSAWSATVLVGLAASVADGEKNYGLVFDAGSSGTRVHVYTYENGGDHGAFDLVSDDLLKIKPGLSSYKDDVPAAGASLKQLLDFSYEKIPDGKRHDTPAYLMATAGLRMVGEEKKDQILNSVCDALTASPYTFKCVWATLLSGFDEGLYGWVTVNYLKKAMASPSQSTYGIIDLGGGSVQIVFEPVAGVRVPDANKGVVPMPKGSKTVYVKSHLGYGLDEARRTIAAVASKEGSKHPCLPSGWKGNMRVTGGEERTFQGGGSFVECAQLTEKIFPEAECASGSCSIQGAYQPALQGEFVGFSYMYDRTKAIGLLDDKPSVYGEQLMSIQQMRDAAERLCKLPSDKVLQKFDKHPDGSQSHQFCGDAVYIATLLEKGFGFSQDTEFLMTNKIGETEIVWTLGAMIAKVNSNASGSSPLPVLLSLTAVAAIFVMFGFRERILRGYGLLPFRSNRPHAQVGGIQVVDQPTDDTDEDK